MGQGLFRKHGSFFPFFDPILAPKLPISKASWNFWSAKMVQSMLKRGKDLCFSIKMGVTGEFSASESDCEPHRPGYGPMLVWGCL